ncbi:hypothetical protein AAU61_17385 [Desulfocarbo indianensis]|nr:hypothetical protein AAU61_17385 [Desulfocarbo indianensis]
MPRNRSQASLAAPAQRAGDLRRKRSLAKTGMTASLGVLAATGIMEGLGGNRSRTVRTLHVLSGLSLVGFSLWHYSLYGTGVRSA